MLINKTEFFTTIKPSLQESGEKNENIKNFLKDFNKNLSNFKNENLILDFSNDINIDLEEILLFSQHSAVHKKNDNSFVLVYNGMNIDKIPLELVAVPTMKEAEDIIELENIERDLGI